MYSEYARPALSFNNGFNKTELDAFLLFPTFRGTDDPSITLRWCHENQQECWNDDGNRDWIADQLCDPTTNTSSTYGPASSRFYDPSAPPWVAPYAPAACRNTDCTDRLDWCIISAACCYRGSGLLMDGRDTSPILAIDAAGAMLRGDNPSYGARANVSKVVFFVTDGGIPEGDEPFDAVNCTVTSREARPGGVSRPDDAAVQCYIDMMAARAAAQFPAEYSVHALGVT